jgi:hypothetical protein
MSGLPELILFSEVENWEGHMSDQHLVNSIIASAILDALKDHPEGGMDPEEAKQVAKCIVEALSSAGLRIVPVSDD